MKSFLIEVQLQPLVEHMSHSLQPVALFADLKKHRLYAAFFVFERERQTEQETSLRVHCL